MKANLRSVIGVMADDVSVGTNERGLTLAHQAAFLAACKALEEVYTRITELDNRSLCYALYRYELAHKFCQVNVKTPPPNSCLWLRAQVCLGH